MDGHIQVILWGYRVNCQIWRMRTFRTRVIQRHKSEAHAKRTRGEILDILYSLKTKVQPCLREKHV